MNTAHRGDAMMSPLPFDRFGSWVPAFAGMTLMVTP
jgi:hypothetical protein